MGVFTFELLVLVTAPSSGVSVCNNEVVLYAGNPEAEDLLLMNLSNMYISLSGYEISWNKLKAMHKGTVPKDPKLADWTFQ